MFGSFSQLFNNPTELQKQIEAQLEVMRRMGEDVDGLFGGSQPAKVMRDEELRGEDFKRLIDTKTTTPFISSSPSQPVGKGTPKLSDDERVMDLLHGTDGQDIAGGGLVLRKNVVTPYLPPGHPKIELWTPAMQSRTMFQGVITTTVRRSDGVSLHGLSDCEVYFNVPLSLSLQSTETKKITYDKHGNQTTTTKTTDKHGNKTETTEDGGVAVAAVPLQERTNNQFAIDKLRLPRYFFANKLGYTLPMNLW